MRRGVPSRGILYEPGDDGEQPWEGAEREFSRGDGAGGGDTPFEVRVFAVVHDGPVRVGRAVAGRWAGASLRDADILPGGGGECQRKMGIRRAAERVQG